MEIRQTRASHPWLRRVSDYHDEAVSAAERAAMEAHLAVCSECREVLDMYRRFYSLLRSPLRLDRLPLTRSIFSDGSAGAPTAEGAAEQTPRSLLSLEPPVAPRSPQRPPRRAVRLLPAIAAGLIVAALASVMVGQSVRLGTSTHHPTPVPSPKSGALQALPTTEFPVPSDGTAGGIALGPDGNLWFTVSGSSATIGGTGGDQIGRITPNGAITEFPLPTPSAKPVAIIVGPDRNLWFTESVGRKIGRITLRGTITEFELPGLGAGPSGIAAGPDGNLWFTATATDGAGLIGRMALNGAVTTFAIATPALAPQGIIAGSDGALWFTEADPDPTSSSGKIGRITTRGAITEFAIPTAGVNPEQITVGPDGNIWFTENFMQSIGGKIGRITPQGTITEFAVPTEINAPAGLIAGPDGNLWIALEDNTPEQPGVIVRITPRGVITEYGVTSSSTGGFFDLAVSADRHLWITSPGTGILRVTTLP